MSQNTATEQAIESAVTEAASVSVDGMSVSKRRISELIQADEHLSRKRASRFPFAFARMRPPGA